MNLMSKCLVLASNNSGKLKELQNALNPLGFEVSCMADHGVESPAETGLSFIENAILKARYVAEKTGLPALADDSGIAVTALDGAPGIYSARYAGPNATDSDNIDQLLFNMADFSKEQRAAQVHCVLAWVQSATDPIPQIFEGVIHCQILTERQGDGGFGYDPILYLPKLGKTFAQMTSVEKHACSHRGMALSKLQTHLKHHS